MRGRRDHQYAELQQKKVRAEVHPGQSLLDARELPGWWLVIVTDSDWHARVADTGRNDEVQFIGRSSLECSYIFPSFFPSLCPCFGSLNRSTEGVCEG